MHPGLLVLGGFLLGTAGVKAACSRPAHRAYVRTTVWGLQAKDYVERVVDEAKAQCDDIMAEAQYVKTVEDAERDADEVIIGQTVIEDEDGDVTVAEETVVEEKE
ncbi:DUF6110 family protein [uncultured Adlercreutzia sp.]|uniref:DUF6110 family protein n=1 Tax=uncultured Adlercreutzia sp. TaxID=875803 RepID=UPI0025FC2163|nr:DUF6110 family protein [uncultured Adlercreutzia sp.]MCI9262359.1 DUF1490 family protein [Eggerthellaceae bacterium]MEE0705488.1 DUF6110 family protein [Adlercreutzia sp.]